MLVFVSALAVFAAAGLTVERPDLDRVSLTIAIALEDAGPCEAELRRGEDAGPRCDLFLVNYRAALRGRVAVAQWADQGRPGARPGDVRRAHDLARTGDDLARAGARILRRIEILTGDD